MGRTLWGVPAFDKIDIQEFIPATEVALREKALEIDSIAHQSEKPSFANTIEALEKTGSTFKRLQAVFIFGRAIWHPMNWILFNKF